MASLAGQTEDWPTDLSGQKSRDSRPAISIAIDELRMTVDSLTATVGTLLDKVGPITAPDLEPSAPMEKNPGLVDASGNSAVTSELNSIGRSLMELIRNVNYVSRRIEL